MQLPRQTQTTLPDSFLASSIPIGMSQTPPSPDAPTAPAPISTERPDDMVFKYHEMIRRAMVDWADEVFDRIAVALGETHHDVLERVRTEMLDKLRR